MRRRHRGMFAPGSRRKRWIGACNTEGVVFTALAAGIWTLGQGAAIPFIVGGLAFMAFLAFRDAQRGWKLNYRIPDRAWRDAKRVGIRGEIARESIADVQKEAKDPNRRIYAFDRKRKGKEK